MASIQSQSHSQPSSTTPRYTGPQSSNAFQAVRRKFSGPGNLATGVGTDFAWESFVTNLRLELYDHLDSDQKKEFLKGIDGLQLFTALQEVHRELAVVKLENHFLTDFLEKNDSRLLIGLKQRRATAWAQRRVTAASGNTLASGNTRQSSSKRSLTLTLTQSIYTSGSSKKANVDYRLNYRAKTDMAEKACADMENHISELERKAMKIMKLLNARIEELHFTSEETLETLRNFQLHFLRDERDLKFLESATEKQLERKFRKFVNNWFKNARALLSTMRLRVTALQESCQQLRGDLITKADLSGILGAVDFEQLIIKRGELLTSLDEKNAHMAGLKGVTGKASLAMAEEKQIMMSIEDESKRITQKTMEVIRAIGKLEREANLVEEENNKDSKTLKNLKEQLERFEAPSINQYIEKKDEMVVLEKEERMLQRKINIMNMKLNNLLKRCKKKE